MVDSSEEKLLQCMLEFKSRITPREMLVLNDFHKRFSTTLRHRELILELIELSQKVRKLADKGKFSQEYSEDFKRIFENLNREVFSKFANILGQEVVCINDEVRLISSSKVATKREVEILRYDYGELNKSISSGLSSNAVRARKILSKRLNDIQEVISGEKEELNLEHHLELIVDNMRRIIDELNAVIRSEIKVVGFYSASKLGTFNTSALLEAEQILSDIYLRLQNLMKEESRLVIEPFNAYLKSKKSISKRAEALIIPYQKKGLSKFIGFFFERKKIGLRIIRSDLDSLTTNPKEQRRYLTTLKRVAIKNPDYFHKRVLPYIESLLHLTYETEKENSIWSEVNKQIRASRKDGLTGALTRVMFEERINLEFEAARRAQANAERTRSRNQTTFSILFMDLDKFKVVNDTYGHDIGDKVLKKFVAVVNSIKREVDKIYRYGGEEFTMILPNTDTQGAFKFAKQLISVLKFQTRPMMLDINVNYMLQNENISSEFVDKTGEKIGKQGFKVLLESWKGDAIDEVNSIIKKKMGDGKFIRDCVTVSIGVANFPDDAVDKEKLVKLSDTALYIAKKTRDTVSGPSGRIPAKGILNPKERVRS